MPQIAAINWDELRPQKQSARTTAVTTGTVAKTALFMPGAQLSCVREAMRIGSITNDTFIFAVERNPRVVLRIQEGLRDLGWKTRNFHVHCGELFDLNLAKMLDSEVIDFAFFDFCGQFSRIIASWLWNNITPETFSVGAPIAFTYAADCRNAAFFDYVNPIIERHASFASRVQGQLIDESGEISRYKSRFTSVAGTVAAIKSFDVDIQHAEVYQDSIPMILLKLHLAGIPQVSTDGARYLAEAMHCLSLSKYEQRLSELIGLQDHMIPGFESMSEQLRAGYKAKVAKSARRDGIRPPHLSEADWAINPVNPSNNDVFSVIEPLTYSVFVSQDIPKAKPSRVKTRRQNKRGKKYRRTYHREKPHDIDGRLVHSEGMSNRRQSLYERATKRHVEFITRCRQEGVQPIAELYAERYDVSRIHARAELYLGCAPDDIVANFLSGSVSLRDLPDQVLERYNQGFRCDYLITRRPKLKTDKNATERLCSKCDRMVPIAHFNRSNNRKLGIHTHCKDCSRKRNRQARNEWREQQKSNGPTTDKSEKTCYTCNLTKPITEFYRNNSNYGGYENRCKTCDHIRSSQRRAAKKSAPRHIDMVLDILKVGASLTTTRIAELIELRFKHSISKHQVQNSIHQLRKAEFGSHNITFEDYGSLYTLVKRNHVSKPPVPEPQPVAEVADTLGRTILNLLHKRRPASVPFDKLVVEVKRASRLPSKDVRGRIIQMADHSQIIIQHDGCALPFAPASGP